jgi:hypothetical protein
MSTILEQDLGEMYRQRGRWFLLLGALLGGIIALASVLGFWLEKWGNHIGGGRGEDAQGIAVALAIVLTVLVIVIALMIWRARVLLARANGPRPAAGRITPQPSSEIHSAVAAWTSSAINARARGTDASPVAHETNQTSVPVDSSPGTQSGTGVTQHAIAQAGTEFTVGSGSGNDTLPEIMHIVESAGIGADEMWSAPGSQGDQVHFVVRVATDTDARLTNAGLRVIGTRDVILIELDDRPGAASEIFRRLTEAGVRVDSAQLVTNTRLVVVSSDPGSVIAVLT